MGAIAAGVGTLPPQPRDPGRGTPAGEESGERWWVRAAAWGTEASIATGPGTGVAAHGADATGVLAAFTRGGTDEVATLDGDYTALITTDEHLIALRSWLGTRPLYLRAEPGDIEAATDATVLRRPTDAIDERRIASFLIRDVRRDQETFWRPIRRVPPGTALVVDRATGTVTESTFGRPDLWNTTADGELGATLRDAVGRALPPGAFATTLSGGLDSTSITLLAAHVRPPLHAISAVFDAHPEADERRWIRRARAGAPIAGHHLVADGLPQLPMGLFPTDQEPVDAVHLGMHDRVFATAADLGASVLLCGTGGDFAVSHGYARLTELTLGGRVDHALAEAAKLAANGYGGTTAALAAAWMVRPLVPEPLLAARRKLTGGDKVRQLPPWIRREFAEAHDLPARLREAWEDWTRPARSARADHIRQIEDPFHPYIAEVLHHLGARHGVEPRFPFLDRRVVTLCVGLPAADKLGGGHTRAALRTALTGLLPEAIRTRTSKANFSRVLHDGLRAQHRTVAEVLREPDSLQPYVDVDALREACAAYLAGADAQWRAFWVAGTLGPFLAGQG